MATKKYVLRKNGLVYYSESKGFIEISSDQHNYKEILDFLVSPEFSESRLFELAKEKFNITKESNGKIKKVGRKLKLGPITVPSSIAAKIASLKSGGFAFAQYEKFWERCLKNPNPNSISQLFRFLEKQNLTICDDGCFFAYKGITDSYRDQYTKTIDNRPGQTVEMPRDRVVLDPSSACGRGLHCGSKSYASSYGSILVLVKVDPADVVSVPFDADAQKIRVCRYIVDSVYAGNAPMKTGVVNVKTKKPVQKQLRKKRWTRSEKEILHSAVKKAGLNRCWKSIAGLLHRSAESCRKKWEEIERLTEPQKCKPRSIGIKKPRWTEEEVKSLEVAVNKLGYNWNAIGKKLNRSAESCRKKWNVK